MYSSGRGYRSYMIVSTNAIKAHDIYLNLNNMYIFTQIICHG